MRIIAGTLRGKTLIAPQGETTRPTSDRARESLFNILNSMLLKQGRLWHDITFADVFAGTGAIGIEAYSRGAREVFCFENNANALSVLKENSRQLSHIHLLGNALTPPDHPSVSVIFMDAPYGKGLWQQALSAFLRAGWIDERTLIVIETDKNLKETLPPEFRLLREHSAGRNTFLFAKQEKES